MKIPFDIKFRPQIESGEYKVVTRRGDSVRIICWDTKCAQPIVGLIYDEYNKSDVVELFCSNGMYWMEEKQSDNDLFIITPEPELTEFEKGIKRGFLCAGLEDVPMGIIKDTAKELIELAKKELCKGCAANLKGYIKGRQDTLKEMEENRVYKHEGPTIPPFWPPCHLGGECTNPFHDCINCPRQSTAGINMTSGTTYGNPIRDSAATIGTSIKETKTND